MLGIDMREVDTEQIERAIAMAEAYVERLTDTCWGGKECRTPGYEHYSLTRYKGGLYFGAGIPVILSKRWIRKVESLQVFTGSEWAEWVGTRTEARNIGDYWIDYEDGILYVNAFWYYQGGSEVRIKYTFGRDDLPGEVQELTTIVALQYMIMLDRRWAYIVESSSPDGREMLTALNDRKRELEDMLRAVKIVRNFF